MCADETSSSVATRASRSRRRVIAKTSPRWKALSRLAERRRTDMTATVAINASQRAAVPRSSRALRGMETRHPPLSAASGSTHSPRAPQTFGATHSLTELQRERQPVLSQLYGVQSWPAASPGAYVV